MSQTVYVVQSHCGDYYCEGEHTEGIYVTLADAKASLPLEWEWRTWQDGGCWSGENAEGGVDIVEQQLYPHVPLHPYCYLDCVLEEPHGFGSCHQAFTRTLEPNGPH